MALSHQKFREIVLQLLYSSQLGHAEEGVMLELMMTELEVSKKNIRLAQEKVQKIIQHRNQIDQMITSISTSYSFERIQEVSKNILRLGIFELFFEVEEPRTPPKVVIAEAIRLSRKFNTPESASFVNALLDHLYQASLGQEENSIDLEKQAQVLLKSEVEAAKQMDEKILSDQIENGQSDE